MSTFKRILAEKTGRKDYGRKGGQGGTRSTSNTPYDRGESRANMQDPSRSQRGGRPDPFEFLRRRKTPVNIPSQSGNLITNFKADANVPPEEQFQRLVDKATKDAERAKDAAKSAEQGGRFGSTKPIDPSERAAARQSGRARTGGSVSPDSLVGNTPRKPQLARRSVRGSYVVKQDQVSKLQKAYRELERQRAFSRAGKSTQARMSRGYGKNLAATGDAIIQSIRDQSKAETAAGNKEFKQQRYGRGKSGPATNLRTPAKTRTYKTGVQKGYFDPKTGRISERGLQKHVNMRTVGGENFGKFKGKDPRSALKGVENIVSRAASGDKAARSEVKRSYKSITQKYAPETGARAARQGSSSNFKSFQQQTKNVDIPKLKPQKLSMPLPGTQQKPVTSPVAQATKERVRQRLNLKIADRATRAKAIVPAQTAAITPSPKGVLAPPASTKIEPVKITVDEPSKSKPYRGLGAGSKETVSQTSKVPELKSSKVTGGSPRVTDLSPSKRPTGTKTFAQFAKSGRTALEKQATIKALQTPTPTKVTAPPKPKAPTKAAVAPKVKAPKITAGGVAGGALSALGAGFDVVQGREDAKKAGASDTRAWLRGAARAAGGLLGGAVGASGGLVGGVAGYSAGSALADKTFTALAGATDAQKAWMKQANLASQKGTAVDKVKYRKGNQAVIYDPRVKKERIGTFDPTSGTFKAANLAKSKAYTAKNPFERLGRQFSRSNEGSGLFGLGLVKGYGLADMAKKYYADKDERERVKRVSDFKKTASAK